MTIKLPKQNNYRVALEKAWERVAARPAADLVELGARRAADREGQWFLSVLDGRFQIDLEARRVGLAERRDGFSDPVSTIWQILALHYLSAGVPVPACRCEISFEEIPAARGYAAPYRGRVVARFCATVGQDRRRLLAASRALGGRIVPGGDVALLLAVFPSVPLRIVWYAGDEELPCGASFLYADNVAALLSVEDIVVMAERVVGRLCGKPW